MAESQATYARPSSSVCGKLYAELSRLGDRNRSQSLSFSKPQVRRIMQRFRGVGHDLSLTNLEAVNHYNNIAKAAARVD